MSTMECYPNPKQLREKSMVNGLAWADQEIQQAMNESAQRKAQALIEKLESKDNHDTTDYGYIWVADNLKFLADKLVSNQSDGIVKSFLNFPKKLKFNGEAVSASCYLNNLHKFRSEGLKIIKPKDGETVSRTQKKYNEFVQGVLFTKCRAEELALVILSESISFALGHSNKDRDNDGKLTSTKTLTQWSTLVSDIVMDELISRNVEELSTLFDYPSKSVLENAKLFENSSGKANAKARKVAEIFNLPSYKKLSASNKLAEGHWLLELTAEAVSDINIDTYTNEIKFTPEALEKLDKCRTRTISTAKELRPVLQKPVADSRFTSYAEFPLKRPMIKDWEGKVQQISDFDREAVDRIQSTAFGVNKNILKVAKQILQADIPVGDDLCVQIPENLKFIEDFPKKKDFKSLEDFVEAKDAWKNTGKMVKNNNPKTAEAYPEINENRFKLNKWFEAHEARQKSQQKARSLNDVNQRVVDIAQWYADWGGAYFLPCYMDYRTRIYYCPTTFNPQASKLAKSLFVAYRSEQIGSIRALNNWYISFAGTMKTVIGPDGTEYGGDKSPINVAKHAGKAGLAQGALVASDPIKHMDLWINQDEPWAYLGHAFECQEVLDNGIEAYSKIFINMDGSCNSNQHSACYLMDRQTAELVNMTFRSDDEAPSDMYGAVATFFKKRLDKSNDVDWALLKEVFITRKSCKKITMTVGYGLSDNGALRNAKEEVEKKSDLYNNNPFDPVGRDAVSERFATGTLDSIGAVAPAVLKSKQFCEVITGLIYTYDKSGVVKWTTPTGTPVSYTKRKSERKRVRKCAKGARDGGLFTMLVKTDIVSRRELTDASTPNFTHGNDGCHLRMSVNGMPEPRPLLMVHDSFGTIARYSPEMYTSIREQWVELYQDKEPLRTWASEVLVNVLKGFNLCSESIWQLDYLEDALDKSEDQKKRNCIKKLVKARDLSVQKRDWEPKEVLTCSNFFR